MRHRVEQARFGGNLGVSAEVEGVDPSPQQVIWRCFQALIESADARLRVPALGHSEVRGSGSAAQPDDGQVFAALDVAHLKSELVPIRAATTRSGRPLGPWL